MVFYDFSITYSFMEKGSSVCMEEASEYELNITGSESECAKKWKDALYAINGSLGIKCAFQGQVTLFAIRGRKRTIQFVMAIDSDDGLTDKALSFLKKHLSESYHVRRIKVSPLRELSVNEFSQMITKADNAGYIDGCYHEITEKLGISYFDNYQFKVTETLYEGGPEDKSEAMTAAKRVMADASFTDELERIYSDCNERGFYGNPVHYKISACSMAAAKDILDVLIPALYKNGRLLGSRTSCIHEIKEQCYDEEELEKTFSVGQGTAVIIEMSGSAEAHANYASAYEDVITFIGSLVSKYAINTLCIFVEIMDKPGFTKSLISRVQDDIDIVEIKEGVGDRDSAKKYLHYLADQSRYADFGADKLFDGLADKETFSVTDVYGIYNRWYRSGLKESVYKAYAKCEAYSLKAKKVQDSAYDRLQKMVGLGDVKALVDQIISAFHIRLLRQKAGLNDEKAAMHMLFTGNPGSAKTTVARLLAEILKTQGVLESGNYVECGRADLVGKYVGWTARIVREKFREARGGVLFIDEAYALLDDSGSFGDEAINTIVQEMENYKDEVIVIFAGYPDKMKDFLEKNEGMQSRIAFRLSFPDYNPDELAGILNVLAHDRGYELEADVIPECMEIFEKACHTDNFGNGRFVRNLLEQATLKQAERLCKDEKNQTVTRHALMLLRWEDFNKINIAELYGKDVDHTIGFRAS